MLRDLNVSSFISRIEVQDVLPSLTSLTCLSAPEIDTWRRVIPILRERAPRCLQINLDRVSEPLLQAIQELRGAFVCGSLLMARQKNLSRFLHQASFYFRSHSSSSVAPVAGSSFPPVTLFCDAPRAHRATNVLDLADGKFAQSAQRIFARFPDFRFFLFLSFSQRGGCPFEGSQCQQASFFGI